MPDKSNTTNLVRHAVADRSFFQIFRQGNREILSGYQNNVIFFQTKRERPISRRSLSFLRDKPGTAKAVHTRSERF